MLTAYDDDGWLIRRLEAGPGGAVLHADTLSFSGPRR
jgi:hypothetical protein